MLAFTEMLSGQRINNPMRAVSPRAGPTGQTDRFECGRTIRGINRVPSIFVAEYTHIGQIVPRPAETYGVTIRGPGNKDKTLTGGQLHVLAQHRIRGLLRAIKNP